MVTQRGKIRIGKEALTYMLLFFGYYKVLFYDFSFILNAVQLGIIVFSVVFILSKEPYIFSVNLDKIKLFIITLIFSVSIILSKIYSISVIYSREKIDEFIMTVAYLLLLFFLAQTIDVSKFLKILYKINYFVIVLYSILHFTELITEINERYGTANAGNPIWISRFCLETVLAMFLLDFEKKRYEFKQIPKYIIPVFVSIRLGSKGPLVAFLISSGFYIILVFSGRNVESRLKKIVRRYLGFFITISVVTMILFWNILEEQFRFSGMAVNVPYRRYHMYNYCINAIRKSFFAGHGLGAFSVNYGGIDTSLYPHNIILEIWYEVGLVAVLCLAVIFVSIIGKTIKYRNLNNIVLASFFVFDFACAMFSGSMFSGNRGVYMFALLFWINYVKEDYNGKSKSALSIL